ncbi:MAG: Zn-ribbon domain-containing OB-fold protein [Gammaproteobacteria bacterium]|nr:Zn-ribbon domain-containing OB-fold protein [Gammaproteobacteria bacterium]
MNSKNQVAAREGWFTLDAERPRLLGSQCQQCHTYYFPVHEQYCRNPECESEQFEQIELSHRGKIWSYTNAAYPPPEPFKAADPYEVFALAAVELEREKLVVLGQLAAGVTVDDVKIGDEVELTLDTLFSDDENDYLVWKWQPVNGGAA